MNVSIFSIGRFHHFDLSRQVLLHGHSLCLFTSNPRAKVDRELAEVVKTRALYRVPYAMGCRLGMGSQLDWFDELLLKDLGKWMTRSLDGEWTELFHAQDGLGPEAGRVAKSCGRLWICDRASTHVIAQREVLTEEHRRWGVAAPRFSSERAERTLREFDEAHAITVPSTYAKRTFLERGFRADRVFVCSYGVDLSEFKPDIKRDTAFRIIFVGQITVRKGIGYLLQAIEPLARKGRCELWLVGEIDPCMRRLLHQYEGGFEYKGVIPRKQLWRLYSQASVLVIASVEEGLALVQAQAMACGLPVIATVESGAEDLFQDGIEGFIVPARSPEAIREKVDWMMDNEVLRKQMSVAARARVESLGGWKSYGDRVDVVYRELAAAHGTRLNYPHELERI